MASLLIKNIAQLVTCDDDDRILKQCDLYCEDGVIRRIGAKLDIRADEVLDGSHMLVAGTYHIQDHLFLAAHFIPLSY